MRMLCRVVLLIMVTACFPDSGAGAAPVVPGFERFGRGAGDATTAVESGLLLLGELGCVNCHAPTKEATAQLMPKRGPVLDRVGERLEPKWLAAYLAAPHAVQPGTTMPDLLAGLPTDDRTRIANAIAHFLAATGAFDESTPPESAQADAREGAAIYQRVGCAACHGSKGGAGPSLSDQLPLVGLDTKWSARGLDAFLKDPFHARPSSRMPAVSLKDDERRHVVAALLGQLPPPREEHRSTVAFNGRVWLVSVDSLPGFDRLGPPAKSGPVTGFDIVQFAGRPDGIVVQLDGFLHAPEAGTYGFHLASDDGSRLFVDGRQVVVNDGIHPESERHGEVVLEAGVHPIRIDFFEAAGGEVLHLDVVPPRRPRRSALEYVTPSASGRPLASMESVPPGAFAVDPALVAEGREAFGRVGCAHCHDVTGAETAKIQPIAAPTPLRDLVALDAGCLAAGAPRPGVPHHGLDEAQRAALQAAIRWLATPAAVAPLAPGLAIDRALLALNCYACHDRDGRGGVMPAVAVTDEDGEPVLKEADRDRLFTSAVQELGDEGRLPPTLTRVGDKLNPAFLREVLVKGGNDRAASMHTRMPRWHAAVVEPLARRLAEDRTTSTPIPELAGHAAAEVDEQGRHLVGSKALGCIKCHAFAGEKGQGLGLIDMTRMPTRLRHEWFLAYVANPQTFRPGTRMPASWPDGKTFYPDILDGTAGGQIEAVWRYLAGAKPRPPIGSGPNTIELLPTERPIIYRNFIEGAGPRAISVGYPEKVHVAWDADRMRLALVWRGAFIDAGRHWTGRGQGFQPPLGDAVFAPDSAAAVAVLDSPESPWPAVQGALSADLQRGDVRFCGYTLDAAGRPTFTWSSGGMRISEHIEPVVESGKTGVRRTVRLAGRPAVGAAWFRAGPATKVEEADGGWLRMDGAWRARVHGAGVGPATRHAGGGKTEVRYPIVWGDGDTAECVEELSW
jgi:mono/diheme cytochrome c family protein